MSYNKNAYIVKDDCAAIKGNAMYFYVWGIVRYNDGFKDNRFTRFCHRYNGNAYYVFPDGKHVGESGLLAEEAKYHQSGNNAD